MNAITKLKLDFQTKGNKMTDHCNSAKEVVFSKIEVLNNGLTLTYKTYNREFECGGWNTKAIFTGNIDDIVDNLNHLIFNCVEFKKQKFENIKISFKTRTGSFKNEK